MSEEHLDKMLEPYNPRLEYLYKMSSPNEPITIYEGEGKLQAAGLNIITFVTIKYEWYPRLGPKVYFTAPFGDADFSRIFNDNHEFLLVIRELVVGKVIVIDINVLDQYECVGIMGYGAILGDKSIPISKIHFIIPNMCEILGENVSHVYRDSLKTPILKNINNLGLFD